MEVTAEFKVKQAIRAAILEEIYAEVIGWFNVPSEEDDGTPPEVRREADLILMRVYATRAPIGTEQELTKWALAVLDMKYTRTSALQTN